MLAIAAVGTAGLRIARNRDAVLAEIKTIRGRLRGGVRRGGESPRVPRRGPGIGLTKGSLVVFDTGGGSSQFTFGTDAGVEERFSVDVGAVRYTERFGLDGAVSSDVLAEAFAAISTDLARLDGRPSPDALVGMGGALTNMAAVSHSMATYDPDVVQGTVLDRAEVDRQIELYRTRDLDARREIVGLQPKRADVILAGACIVRTVMEKLGQDSLTISDRGCATACCLSGSELPTDRGGNSRRHQPRPRWRARCWWGSGDELYRPYHDREWGRPVSDDRRLFEKLSLEDFMAGLSWLTILRKRENFRAAFANFEIDTVAGFGTDDVERLLADAGIVRHRGKIEAVINNARAASRLSDEFGSLAAYAWGYEPVPSTRPVVLDREALMQLDQPRSVAMSKDLRRRGWSFVGPTTVYSFMEAMGLVNDHLVGCAFREPVEAERRAFRRP